LFGLSFLALLLPPDPWLSLSLSLFLFLSPSLSLSLLHVLALLPGVILRILSLSNIRKTKSDIWKRERMERGEEDVRER
jgi:hypothetical protein